MAASLWIQKRAVRASETVVGVGCHSFLKKEGGLTMDLMEGENEWRASQFSFVNIPSLPALSYFPISTFSTPFF